MAGWLCRDDSAYSHSGEILPGGVGIEGNFSFFPVNKDSYSRRRQQNDNNNNKGNCWLKGHRYRLCLVDDVARDFKWLSSCSGRPSTVRPKSSSRINWCLWWQMWLSSRLKAIRWSTYNTINIASIRLLKGRTFFLVVVTTSRRRRTKDTAVISSGVRPTESARSSSDDSTHHYRIFHFVPGHRQICVWW